jgi:hypothetical protein
VGVAGAAGGSAVRTCGPVESEEMVRQCVGTGWPTGQ